MSSERPFPSVSLVALLACSVALLAGCGGGGGSGTPAAPPPPAAVPASGTYAWVLKAEGATGSLKYGLSLVHPSATGVEWVVETANGAVSDAKLVASGTVDAATQKVSAIQPYALVYIVGGDVRRVPLAANGQAPKGQVQASGTSSACGFVIDAVDHAAPENSRFVVSTAGADGQCGSTAADATAAQVAQAADNGRAEVRLSATAPGITVTPIVGAAPLAALRDPATLAPRGWLYPTQAVLWNPAPGTTVTVRQAADAITRVVAATWRSALVESAGGLALVDFPGGSAFTDTAVNAAAASGWQGIGHDAQYLYAWRNSGDETGSWQVMRVNRGSGLAGTLGSGTGAVAVASLGKDAIYLTVLGAGGNALVKLNKLVPGAAVQTVESGARSVLPQVLATPQGVHQLWRVTGVGTSSPSYALQIFDESGTTLFSSTGGGFPLQMTGGSTLDYNSSENRTTFLFADGYGNRAFGDATLTAYDTVARARNSLGRLPGAAEFGGDFVFANASAGPGSFAAGYAARSIGGVLQSAGTKVFTFDTGTAASLKSTSSQQ